MVHYQCSTNRRTPLQLNAGLLLTPTRPAPQNMLQLSADTPNNLTGPSAARPGLSSSFKSSPSVTISKPPTPMTPAGPNSSFQGSSGVSISPPPTPTGSSAPRLPSSFSFQSSLGASIRKPLTTFTNTGAKPSKAEHPRLPSSEIKKEKLQSVDMVMKKYIKLAGKESSAGEFASKLAREAYFGTDVMRKCTCNGSADKLG